MNAYILKESTLEREGPCLVSKWLDFPLLLSLEELKELFLELSSFFIVHTDRVLGDKEGILFPLEFVNIYANYLVDWQEGRELNVPLYKKVFQGTISTTLDAFYAIKVERGKRIIKALEPTLLLQPYRIEYSAFDGKIRPMTMGKNNISWGLQISYPQLYQDPKSGELKKIDDTFSNTHLFRKFQKWVRYNTSPTTFCMPGETKITLPMRIGRSAYAFVNKHAGLLKSGIKVMSTR